MMRLVCVLVLLFSSAAQAVVGGVPPAEDDRRFDAVGAWSRASWLGLGNNPIHQHNWFGGAVLLRANLVATVKHIAEHADAPAGTYAVRFRRRIDGGLGTKDQGATSYHHALVERIVHGPGDLALAYLAEPVTHINPIEPMQMGFMGLEGASYIHAGWGQEGPGREEGPRNQLLLCAQNQLTEVRLHSVTYPGLGGENPPPCAVNRWDSGGAVLIDDGGTLRLLGNHSTYFAASTLAPWLGQEGVSVLHRPLPVIDLALEALDADFDELMQGGSASVDVRYSNPGNTRRTDVPARLVASLQAVGSEQWLEVGALELPTRVVARTVAEVTVPIEVPEDLPVSLYTLRVVLEPNGEDARAHNNQLILSTVLPVRDRREPLESLSIARLLRVVDGAIDHVVLLRALRRSGDQALWVWGHGEPLNSGFERGVSYAPAGDVSVETPWGTFGVLENGGREPLVLPEGFTGQFISDWAGVFAMYRGLYHGQTAMGQPAKLGLLGSGFVAGGWTREGDQHRLFAGNLSRATLTAEGPGQSATSGVLSVRLLWDAVRNLPALEVHLDDGAVMTLWREGEPADLGAPCRESEGCRSGQADEAALCLRGSEQEFGVCVLRGCTDDANRCGVEDLCVASLDQCAPRCSDDAPCIAGLSCAPAGFCADCTAHPELCVRPDAGPSPDAGFVDASELADDVGSVQPVEPVVFPDAGVSADAGIAPAPPAGDGAGCSCRQVSLDAGLWLIAMVALLRRRSRA